MKNRIYHLECKYTWKSLKTNACDKILVFASFKILAVLEGRRLEIRYGKWFLEFLRVSWPTERIPYSNNGRG